MGNTFMNAAAKSKRKQAGIARAEREVEDLVAINVRIPKEMHRKLWNDRIETGESMTELINRLLVQELG